MRESHQADSVLELKALGTKALYDVQGLSSGLIGSTINIVKETPNMVMTGLKAVGNLGNILSGGDRSFSGEQDPDSDTKALPKKQLATFADLGLLLANEIDSQISNCEVSWTRTSLPNYRKAR